VLTDNDKSWIAEQLAASERRTADRIEVTETRLLTEFHRWAQTYEIRVRATSRTVADFDERLGLIEERVSSLERKRGQE